MSIDRDEFERAVEYAQMRSDITAALSIAKKAQDDLAAFKEAAQKEKEHFLRWGVTTLLVILGAAAAAALNILITGRPRI